MRSAESLEAKYDDASQSKMNSSSSRAGSTAHIETGIGSGCEYIMCFVIVLLIGIAYFLINNYQIEEN